VKTRLRTKVIAWLIFTLLFAAAAFVLWRMVSAGEHLKAFVIVAFTTAVAWRAYSQARSAKRR
jgi:hypothetical protein